MGLFSKKQKDLDAVRVANDVRFQLSRVLTLQNILEKTISKYMEQLNVRDRSVYQYKLANYEVLLSCLYEDRADIEVLHYEVIQYLISRYGGKIIDFNCERPKSDAWDDIKIPKMDDVSKEEFDSIVVYMQKCMDNEREKIVKSVEELKEVWNDKNFEHYKKEVLTITETAYTFYLMMTDYFELTSPYTRVKKGEESFDL